MSGGRGKGPRGPTIRVLIVDDHEMVAQSFARVLRDEKDLAVVGIASNVADAVRRAGELQPGVVLMDYQLPDGDGVEAARQLAGHAPSTKVIILTGSGNAAAQIAAASAHCAAYLEKTRASLDLADVIRRVHAGEVILTQQQVPTLPSLDELALHYQPIVDLRTEATTGFEALVRWQHPQRGLLFPRDFIGLAEETGFVNEIGAWVLGQATRQLAQWQHDYPRERSLEMAVNVSARQLQRTDWVASVARLLDETGVHEGLVIEITETVFLDGSDRIVGILDDLRQLGCRIALDDFGTGYSSLAYLRRFPIDVIKMDRCFTEDLPYGTRSLVLADTICTLGKELSMTVVAEGIETAEQVAYLRELGPIMGQGYYFRRPQPAAAAEAALSDAGRRSTALAVTRS